MKTTGRTQRHGARALIEDAAVLVLTASTATLVAADGRELTDAELDEVVAGTVDQAVHEDLLRFSYVGAAGSKHAAELDGTLSLSGAPRPGAPTGLLILDNGAQTNLRSLVNLNAVNSEVNVLLNLNININSTVGELRQLNIRSE